MKPTSTSTNRACSSRVLARSHREARCDSALLAQSAIDALFSQWDDWAVRGDPEESRDTAVSILKDCVMRSKTAVALPGLKLRGLPENLPATIEVLDLEDNALTEVPDSLPRGIRELNLKGNSLAALPDSLPNSLLALNASNNHLRALPESLPSGLLSLTVSRNWLESLPQQWPPGLTYLDVGENKLRGLPDTMSAGLKTIYAQDNRLSELPDRLPDSVKCLWVDKNQLIELPERLPGGLQQLSVNENLLTALPTHLPPRLSDLLVSSNCLTHLPETLPDTLTLVDVSSNSIARFPRRLPESLRNCIWRDNRLTDVPMSWPLHLEHAFLSRNQIGSLPESIFQHLHGAHLDLTGNPLSARWIDAIRAGNIDFTDSGSVISILSDIWGDVPEGTRRTPLPLDWAAAAWYPDDQRQAVNRVWRAWAQQPGGAAFGAFLCSLRDSVNIRDPEFEREVGDWLSHLANTESLREVSFAIALDASDSCEDRAALAFLDLQVARIAHEVENGMFDHRIEELLTHARAVFRRECLEAIAHEKVKTLPFADEIEVHLGYQVKLNDALRLNAPLRDMRFFDVSGITEADLSEALHAVQCRENEEFATWLVRWSPWERMLVRRDPRGYEAMEAHRHQVLEERFDSELEAMLRDSDLVHDADARRIAGVVVLEAIDKQAKLSFTEAFLAARAQKTLLSPVWTDGMPPSQD